jgi:hypothetical protein
MQGQYDSNPSRVSRTTPRAMDDLRGSCGPLVATLLHDLGVGAVAPWIIYAILVAPMIVMLSHREIDIDPLIRWVLYVIIAITPVLFWSPGG